MRTANVAEIIQPQRGVHSYRNRFEDENNASAGTPHILLVAVVGVLTRPSTKLLGVTATNPEPIVWIHTTLRGGILAWQVCRSPSIIRTCTHKRAIARITLSINHHLKARDDDVFAAFAVVGLPFPDLLHRWYLLLHRFRMFQSSLHFLH